MYVKRNTINKSYPIPRKGTKYIAVPTHEKRTAIPLVVVVRDILKFVKNKKELQTLINEKKVYVNGKIIRNTNYGINLFDSIEFPSIKKYYRMVLRKNKMDMEEINEKDSLNRVYKVINKKQLKNKKIQINLNNGKNIISSEKIKVGNFITLNHSDNKIEKIISLEKGSKVIVIKGKYKGVVGTIKGITKENFAEIKTEDNQNINVEFKNLFLMI